MKETFVKYAVLKIEQKDFRIISEEDRAKIEKMLSNGIEFLSDFRISDMEENAIALYHEDVLCGFYNPTSRVINGKTYFSIDPAYIFPEFKGIGIEELVFGGFFVSHKGYVWIDENNSTELDFYKRYNFVGVKQAGSGYFYTNDSKFKM